MEVRSREEDSEFVRVVRVKVRDKGVHVTDGRYGIQLRYSKSYCRSLRRLDDAATWKQCSGWSLPYPQDGSHSINI